MPYFLYPVDSYCITFTQSSAIYDQSFPQELFRLHAKLAEELCMNDIRSGKRYFYENTLIYNMMPLLSPDESFTKNAYSDLIAFSGNAVELQLILFLKKSAKQV